MQQARSPALRRLRERRERLLTSFRPSVAFEAFCDDDSPNILCRAANGAGKTRHVAYKIARQAVKRRIRVRWLGPSSAQVREVAARYLWEFLRPYCADGVRYTAGIGFTRNNEIELVNGSIIQLKSYQDPIDAHAGDEFDIVVFDEVPPFSHYEENAARVGRKADSLGQVLMLFTAVNRPSEWVRKEIEGADPSPTGSDGWVRVEHTTRWVQYVVPFRYEYVRNWHTPESFEDYASKWRGKDTEPQRLHAAWEGAGQSRRLAAFGSSTLLSLEQLRRIPFDEFRLGIDHGTGFGKQYAALIGVVHDGRAYRYHHLAEYVGEGNTTPVQDATGILGMLHQLSVSPFDVDAAFGDIGEGGRFGTAEGGGRWNAKIEEAVAEILGMRRCPFRITVPYKRRKAGPAGEAAMNHAFLEGRFFVNRANTFWIRAAMQYTGKEEDLKDPIDGVRYAIQDLLLGPQAERIEEWVAV